MIFESMYVSVVFLEADNNVYYNGASARHHEISSGKNFDAKKSRQTAGATYII